MYTLFIDTHNEKIVIVLYKDKKVFCIKEEEAVKNHSVMTMPLINEILENNNIDTSDLSEIIVCNGPGSFTGIRIGVTIAKTLAYTLNIPIKTISSLLMKAVSLQHDDIKILEKEKNGYFISTFSKDNRLIGNYEYVKEIELDDSMILDVNIDYEKIINFLDNEKSINPHLVNPLYVKVIEVQK